MSHEQTHQNPDPDQYQQPLVSAEHIEDQNALMVGDPVAIGELRDFRQAEKERPLRESWKYWQKVAYDGFSRPEVQRALSRTSESEQAAPAPEASSPFEGMEGLLSTAALVSSTQHGAAFRRLRGERARAAAAQQRQLNRGLLHKPQDSSEAPEDPGNN